MPVSALVVTLDPNQRDGAIERLSLDPRITLGELQTCQLPVVLDTQSVGEGRALVEELQAVAGVTLVNIVMVDFSDADEEDAWNDASF
jgi:nitrate reductase NapAB chaperone NapD